MARVAAHGRHQRPAAQAAHGTELGGSRDRHRGDGDHRFLRDRRPGVAHQCFRHHRAAEPGQRRRLRLRAGGSIEAQAPRRGRPGQARCPAACKRRVRKSVDPGLAHGRPGQRLQRVPQRLHSAERDAEGAVQVPGCGQLSIVRQRQRGDAQQRRGDQAWPPTDKGGRAQGDV